jgi:hypothetical protein
MNNITGDSIELSSWFFVRDFVLNPVRDFRASVWKPIHDKINDYEFRK